MALSGIETRLNKIAAVCAKSFLAKCTRFVASRSGGIAIMTALATPVMLAGLGVAIDYGTLAMRANVARRRNFGQV